MNKKELLFISLGIFLTVIVWVVADIYHASVEDKIKDRVELPDLRNYTIDKKVLEIIKSRED